MTSSTSFIGKKIFLLAAGLILLWGCAAARKEVTESSPSFRAESGRSPEHMLVPKLVVSALSSNKKPPQAAGMATVRWQVEARGGAGERAYTFRITDGKEERVAQEGGSPTWNWVPPAAGSYRVKAVVRDATGTVAESGWSPEYLVVPGMEVSPATPDKEPPRAAEMATVRWKVEAKGGVGNRTYAFRITDGKEEKVTQESESASWAWVPTAPGTYRVKVVVRDAIGNAVENGWSPEYKVVPKMEISSLLPDSSSPQAAEMAMVRWKVRARGGVGEPIFAFWVSDGKTESLVQEGSSAVWVWAPSVPGIYRVKATVRDSLGNVAESGWSAEYAVTPKLEVPAIAPDKEPPQAAGTTAIMWSAAPSGGVAPHSYEFVVSDGKQERREQAGPSSTWPWRPGSAGTYRVKAVVWDALGNRAESGWSAEYVVTPKLEVSVITPDKASPQAVGTTAVLWSAASSGGVGPHSYEFVVSDGKQEKREQAGPSSTWPWRPESAGTYKVKVVVRDALGNRAESAWSSVYEIKTKISYFSPVAVLPLENLSGTVTPLKEIRKSLIEGLVARGFIALEERSLEQFMARHRIRYFGGIDGATAKAFKEETGAGAILITSLELYNDMTPPKIALTSRLVSTEESPVILWMDSVGLAGDDAPGILDLGLIENPTVLRDKALRALAASLSRSLEEGWVGDSMQGKRKKFRPKINYRSPAFDPQARHTVAIVPFFNQSTRKFAGEIMQLHLARQLATVENIRFIEPGVVRKELLALRVIMEEGISLAQSDLMWDTLGADLLLSGKVFDYQDYQGPNGDPVVDFSLQLIERKGRQVGWASKSYNRGTDGVWFFDMGRERTASSIASKMSRIVTEWMWK